MKRISSLFVCCLFVFCSCSDDDNGIDVTVCPMMPSEDTYELTDIYFDSYYPEIKEFEEFISDRKVANYTSQIGAGRISFDELFVNRFIFTVVCELQFEPEIEEKRISIPFWSSELEEIVYKDGIFCLKEYTEEIDKNIVIEYDIPPYSEVVVKYFRKYKKLSVPYYAKLKGKILGNELEVDGLWEAVLYIGESTVLEVNPLTL